MRLIDMSISDFCDELDSNSLGHNGGAISALISNIGIGLARMMSYLSFGKKEYESLDESIRLKFVDAFNDMGDLRQGLIDLIDEEANSLDEYNRALKMPQNTDEEIKQRKAALQDAILFSIEVYFKVSKLSQESLKHVEYIIEYGNFSDVSDIGMGILMIYTGIEGAILKIKEKLILIEDRKINESYDRDLNIVLSKSKIIRDILMEKVYIKIGIKNRE